MVNPGSGRTEPIASGPAVLFTQEQIADRVRELAGQISADYAGRELLVVGVLKGSWIFMADLVRLMTIPVTVDFMMASSYGSGSDSSGVVRVVLDLKAPVEGRDLLVVDDILDSGLTLGHIIDTLKIRKPHSLRIAALLDKPDRRRADIKVDYVGFQVPDKFVVGYGLDFAERFRNLPYVGYVET
ncbi:MAG TPA: hypoxanthine phosphoribosyltransferase [bacterium]|nr:hypoxanthine phosphoribosyltransferase [bacterium]